MLPAASSNRSKNWRSRDTSTCDRRGMKSSTSARRRNPSRAGQLAPRSGPAARGNIAPSGDETSLGDSFFHLGRERRIESLAQCGRRSLPVVLGAALLDLAVVAQQGVGGAVVAVERHADAAGVQELDAGVRLAAELQVRVPEDEPRLEHAREHLLL